MMHGPKTNRPWPVRVAGSLAIRLAIVGGGWAIVAGAVAAEDPAAGRPSVKDAPAARPAGSPTIDDELLRDLPPLTTKPGTPADQPGTDPQRKPPREDDSAKPKSAPSSDEGEDIEIVGPDEFLRDIRRRMKQVEQRLQGQDLSRSTQAEQEKIAAELASFIRQLQRQQSQGNGLKSKQGGSGVASDQTGGAQQPTKGPAVDSAERNTESARLGDGPASLQTSLPGVWGNLSPQLRQQIQSLTGDKFLPQYERLIQQYYRRLAESRKGS